MMTMQDLIDWIKPQLSPQFANAALIPGSRMPDDPNAGAKFQRLEGSGLSVEYLFDGFGFNVEVQGEQNDYASAEALMFEIDRIVIGQGGSRLIGSYWCADAQRFSGSPAELDTDDADRTHFQCIYSLEIESGI